MRRTFWMGCVAALALLGCGNKDSGSAPAGSGAAAVSGAPAGSTAKAAGGSGGLPTAENGGCGMIGCGDRKGDFFQMCECKGKNMTPPIVATYTGKMDDFYKKPIFEAVNTSDRPIHWASVSVYYYDKSGKQLEIESKDKTNKWKKAASNGSNFTLKPKEKKNVYIGFSPEITPKEAVKLEAVIDGWCYGVDGDKSTELCVNGDPAPEDRPPSK